VPDFIESSRYVVIDKFENYWISHPYHGVFKIQPNANGKYLIKQYSEKNGLPLLLDNQIKIFSIYKNLSSEKTLIQQFNALNQEMDLLKLQLTKINQLLNDTIAEKCKQELKHHQQQMEIKNKKGKNHAESLFRADLVPIGNVMTSSNTRENEQLSSSSNLWKLNTNNKQNSNSNENLTNIQK
jgi:hypothetical protein